MPYTYSCSLPPWRQPALRQTRVCICAEIGTVKVPYWPQILNSVTPSQVFLP